MDICISDYECFCYTYSRCQKKYTYDEPQKIKEQAVEAGVGKFKADEKGKVSFYFIRHDGTEVKYENPKVTAGDLK